MTNKFNGQAFNQAADQILNDIGQRAAGRSLAHWVKRSALLSCAFTAVVAGPALAQSDVSSTPQTEAAQPGTLDNAPGTVQNSMAIDTLFGDWGGLKSSLKDKGIFFSLGYKGEVAGNLSGGKRHDVTEVGQIGGTATVDTEQLFGLKGGTFQTTVTYRHGPDLGQRTGMGLLVQVQEVAGRGQTARLSEFWYQQLLADGAVALKVGRMTGGEFNGFGCDFTNLTFCGAPAGSITSYYYNYPISQWAGWAKIMSGQFYLKAGATEDNRNNLDEKFFLSRGRAQGVILHAEAGWAPAFSNGRLPGWYRAGYWHTSGNSPDALLDGTGRPYALTSLSPREVGGQWGMYLQGEQQITGSASEDPVSNSIKRSRGINVFFNLTRNDPATATTLDQETVGFYMNAPFSGRPNDHLGFAVGRTGFNGRAARSLVLATPGAEKPKAEYPIELYYALHAMRGVVLRPNLQYVVDPGGLRSAPNAFVVGGRFDITL